jgi:hypothetical protein
MHPGIQCAIVDRIQADRDADRQVSRVRRGSNDVDGTASAQDLHLPVT